MLKLFNFIKCVNIKVILPLSFLRVIICFFFILFSNCDPLNAGSAKAILEKGWASLIKDHEEEAISYFGQAYDIAKKENNKEETAEALLDLGISTYSISYSKGLDYCFQAMKEYKALEKKFPEKSFKGRSKCLQLISTIYSRQGNYKAAIAISQEAREGFPKENDSTGYLGLIYTSLGNAYGKLNVKDSAEYYHQLALKEHLLANCFVYLPNSYINVANHELEHELKEQSLTHYSRALFIADSTFNKQSQVSALIGLGKWNYHFKKDKEIALDYLFKAKSLASILKDKSFYLSTLDQLIILNKEFGDYQQALLYKDELMNIKDSLNTWEKQKAIKNLEVQFNLSEKDRKLEILQKEKDISNLTNYLLFGSITILALISIGIILFLRKINKRGQELVKVKEALVITTEERERLKEKQLLNEIEFKENQLSAMTFQMLQKNELMQEIKEQLADENFNENSNSINRIINKGLNHDKDWKDFNTYFESINKNFYAILKKEYPDISPNDLKICALIKLNMSSKEMAGILNISPDSVKTARYRLRKKLQLNSEDNLTDFILGI